MNLSVEPQASATRSQKPVVFPATYGFLGFEWCNRLNGTTGERYPFGAHVTLFRHHLYEGVKDCDEFEKYS